MSGGKWRRAGARQPRRKQPIFSNTQHTHSLSHTAHLSLSALTMARDSLAYWRILSLRSERASPRRLRLLMSVALQNELQPLLQPTCRKGGHNEEENERVCAEELYMDIVHVARERDKSSYIHGKGEIENWRTGTHTPHTHTHAHHTHTAYGQWWNSARLSSSFKSSCTACGPGHLR